MTSARVSPPHSGRVAKDAYLRWRETTMDDIQSPIGYLVTVTTRLCLDRLRHLKREREEYTETWLPEALEEDCLPSPEEQLEIAGEVAVAFFAVLERLNPQERTVFLLREVFDYDYPEVARMVDKSESACRQLIHRSRSHLRESRARFTVIGVSRARTQALSRRNRDVRSQRRGDIAGGRNPLRIARLAVVPRRRPSASTEYSSTTISSVGTFASRWGVLSEQYNILRQNQSDTNVVQYLQGCD